MITLMVTFADMLNAGSGLMSRCEETSLAI